MPAPMIKGRLVIDAVQLAREKLGEQFVAQCMDKLEAPLRRLFDVGIVQSSWYPLELMTRFMEIECELIGIDDAVFGRLAEETTKRQLSGTYRALVQPDPLTMISKHVAVQQTYLKDVETTLVSVAPGEALFRLRGLGKRHRLIGPVIAGYVRQSMRMTGARDPEAVFIVTIGDPIGYADLRITWN